MGTISSKAVEERFYRFVGRFDLFKGKGRIGMGVSGGPDSVCLALLMKRYARQMLLEPVVIHVNHHLRGKESDRDERFVRELARDTLGLEFAGYDVRFTRKELKGNSPEAIARDKRYAAFDQARRTLNLGCIALAHTMNDNAETVLLNMLRGTGITGISGIPPVRDYIVRPMLGLSRDDVMAYLRSKKAAYMHDSTNDSADHLRNRVRREIIPGLIKLNPGFLNHALSLACDLREIDGFLNDASLKAYADVATDNGHGKLFLDIKKLLGYDRPIIERILQKAIRAMLDTHYNPRREYIDHTMDILMNRDDNSRTLAMFPGRLRIYKNSRALIFDKLR
ncbi:MAG: tRNA lysidine(34) synthetase TilS [Deltaproteobacteria bacterium]|nr:tRNA lysidine(34) synthetase TilS [Deltaproteobacteria bacterium]MCL5277093.1 tRNA lysidine(34) synthetase TilS [Deltaproteobacteria bacterium]